MNLGAEAAAELQPRKKEQEICNLIRENGFFFTRKGFTLALGRKSSIETSVSHLEHKNTVMATAITLYYFSELCG